MDQDRIKVESPGPSPCLDKLGEHNYTNAQAADNLVTITRLSPGCLRQQAFRQIAPKPADYIRVPPPVPIATSVMEQPKVTRKEVFNRIRRSEAELGKAAEMVRGGMTFQTASDTFNIPISTIRFYMARRGILPQRRRGRGSSGVRDDDLIHPPFEIIHYRLPDIDKPL